MDAIARASSLGSDRWAPLSPQEVADLFVGYDGVWWIAGGWAVDLFLEERTRSHDDIDVAVLRADQGAVQRRLADWELWLPTDPHSRSWKTPQPLPPGVNSVWCRRSSGDGWGMELLLMDSDHAEWVYRRKPSIRRPLHSIGRHDPTGLPYLAPEVQLLFKAKYRSAAKNEADFSRVLPRLGQAALEWLAQALLEEFPDGHEWLDRVHSRWHET
jgi:hypothetical protein